MSHSIKTANIPSVPGVEQMDEAPDGATRFLGPYFTDEIPQMVEAAKGLRDRERHVIATDGNKFSIYRRASK